MNRLLILAALMLTACAPQHEPNERERELIAIWCGDEAPAPGDADEAVAYNAQHPIDCEAPR